MKTAGILTTYFASNFGAMLQPFALKRTLEQMGLEVEILRYKQPAIWMHYNPFTWRRFASCKSKNPLKFISNLLYVYPLMCIKELKFRSFSKKFLNRQGGFDTKWPKDKDYYFIGSDQLWRPQNTGGKFDDVYFGYFESKHHARKISYAVSGEAIEYTEENIDYLRNALKNFDSISVREDKLASDLKQVTGVTNIEVVADPTLLCNPSVFEELPSKHPCPGKKFVLFYQIRGSYAFLDKIYECSRKQGAELVILSSYVERKFFTFALSHKHVHYFPSACEDIFLGAMKNAETVFTPSFHGNVFALLNHRSIFDIILDDGHDTRAKELLFSLGIEGRFLRIGDPIVETPISWSKVEEGMEYKRKRAMNFIKHALAE